MCIFLVTKIWLDDVLENFFLSDLTVSFDVKKHFDLTLASPRNVQINFFLSGSQNNFCFVFCRSCHSFFAKSNYLESADGEVGKFETHKKFREMDSFHFTRFSLTFSRKKIYIKTSCKLCRPLYFSVKSISRIWNQFHEFFL